MEWTNAQWGAAVVGILSGLAIVIYLEFKNMMFR